MLPSRMHIRSEVAPQSRAFTVVELLVVVAIIALLVALLIVGLEKARTMARVAGCLSNQRQISLAQASYALDNVGAYASNRTSGMTNLTDMSWTINVPCGQFPVLINKGNTNQDSYHSWVASYGASVVGGTEMEYGVNSTNTAAKALSKGRLYSYMGSASLYRSPLDPTTRIRSYSLQSFIGALVPEDSREWSDKWDDWCCAQGVTPREWTATHSKHHKFPSQTIMSIVEDDSDGFNYNNQGWVIDIRPPAGTPAPPGTPNPGAWGSTGGWDGWIDWPAFWEPNNITYSYVDGSTEAYSLQKPKLVSEIQGPPGAGMGHRYPAPADNAATGPWRRDWIHFRDRLFPGVLPPVMPRFQDH